ncbi:short-chain dehydrogenase [Peniophora sp. CONT]|nr:short-chain dehydrogenase [Peniophora sp. CONT]
MKAGFLTFIRDQLRTVPPVVQGNLTGKTVMLVGANAGIGLEASKHFAGMKPARLLLACRNEQKGRAAIKAIEEATGYTTAELVLVDLDKFASVDALVARFEKEQLALDLLVYNAGVLFTKHELTTDGWEPTLQVNSLSAMLLSVLLVPACLRAAEARPTSHPRIIIVGSFVHYLAVLPKSVLEADNIMKELNKPEQFEQSSMQPRYNQSKLLSLFVIRALAKHLARTPIITINPHPGYCYSELRRNYGWLDAITDRLMEKLLARTSEQGSRDLVFAAVGGTEDEDALRGAFTNLQKVQEPSDFVISEVGQETQKRIWAESVAILSEASPRFREIVATHLSA